MNLTTDEIAMFEAERTDYAHLLKSIREKHRPTAIDGVQLVCLGNTGGATSVVTGRPAGGFLLRSADRTLIVDPGDNCFAFLVRNGFDPFEITDVLATHAHNDHVGDLSLAVSAAIKLGLRHDLDATIIVPPSLVDYANAETTRFGFTLPAYAWRAHVRMLFHSDWQARRFDGTHITALPETTLAGGVRVIATEARHAGTPAMGVILETPMGKIGYTGDTEYFDALPDQFAGVDLLWINMNTLALDAMIPAHVTTADEPPPTHNHLGYVGACRLIEDVRPRIAIVTHFGAQLIERRAAVEHAMQARFEPLGVTVHCPENMACMTFRTSLSETPEYGSVPW